MYCLLPLFYFQTLVLHGPEYKKGETEKPPLNHKNKLPMNYAIIF